MSDPMYPVPILFIFFNRKEIALQSFERIKNCKPKTLYLASDGHRADILNEEEKVLDIRYAILSEIDWDCDVKTLFHDKNLGCRSAVCLAVHWLFSNEKQGIILEDDCMVQQSFFPFMQEMLEKYKDNSRIGMIDGANYISYPIKDSYCFSKYKSTNGWATWQRAWKNMDMDMNWLKTTHFQSVLKNMGYCGKDVRYWKYRLKVIDKNYASVWDWQWYFSLASQNQLSIFPKVSLVSNIGFGLAATHTAGKADKKYFASDELTFPLTHPDFVLPDAGFDRAFYRSNNTFADFVKRYIPLGLKKKIKKWIY
jgi:hypothetical protein